MRREAVNEGIARTERPALERAMARGTVCDDAVATPDGARAFAKTFEKTADGKYKVEGLEGTYRLYSIQSVLGKAITDAVLKRMDALNQKLKNWSFMW